MTRPHLLILGRVVGMLVHELRSEAAQGLALLAGGIGPGEGRREGKDTRGGTVGIDWLYVALGITV